MQKCSIPYLDEKLLDCGYPAIKHLNTSCSVYLEEGKVEMSNGIILNIESMEYNSSANEYLIRATNHLNTIHIIIPEKLCQNTYLNTKKLIPFLKSIKKKLLRLVLAKK